LDGIVPIVSLLELPAQTAKIFLFGFFRRDYGAAGLFDMIGTGLLTLRQTVVTAVTLTLFIPCVAQFIIMIKERGFKTAVYIALFIIPFSFLCGYVINIILKNFGGVFV
jgi:ferrous iron transport protein B